MARLPQGQQVLGGEFQGAGVMPRHLVDAVEEQQPQGTLLG